MGLFVGCTTVAAGSFLAGGCSSKEDGAAAPAASKGAAPTKPSADPTSSTEEHNYAVRKVYLGDSDRKGVASGDAWRAYGFDLDGKKTATKDDASCKNANGTVADGDDGIDNAFGSKILPLVTTVQKDVGKTTNDIIENGTATIMISVKGIDDKAIPQTNTGLTAQLFGAGKFSDAGKPTWTTADDWPVRPELLNGGTLAGGSAVAFSDAWIKDGQFSTGAPSKVRLQMQLFGNPIDITIHRAVIVFDHDAAGKAVNGTVAGVIETEELIAQATPLAGRANTALCPGTELLDNVLQNLRNASDMLVDGDDPSRDCNGISIGVGFEATEIGLPKTVAPPAGPPGPDPCTADAGTN